MPYWRTWIVAGTGILNSKHEQHQHYLRVSALLRPSDKDAFVTWCWEEDTLGMQESAHGGRIEVQAYFSSEQQAETLLVRLRQKALAESIEIEQLALETAYFDPDQWLAQWQASFSGFPVGESFFIHPPWESPSPSHAINLELEPGHAFGTGTHESTQLCLMALEGMPSRPGSLLDVGTGSGILALAAARLFAPLRVVAVDIDPQSVAVARQNFRRNAVRRVLLAAAGVEALRAEFDLVVANITLGVFRDIAPDLIKLARDRLIVSGFTEEQGHLIRDLFEPLGASVEQQWVLQGWLCFQLCQPAASSKSDFQAAQKAPAR